MDLQVIFGNPPAANPDRARGGAAASPSQVEPVGPEAWNSDEAVRLIVEADDWFSRLGVSGAHPSVQAAADRVLQAALRRSMPALRAALQQFRQAAQRLAGRRT
jgi:hypothetical protein